MSNKYKKIIALVLVVVMLGSGFAVLSSMVSPQSSVNNPYITAPSSPSSVINTNTNISENISYYQNANIGTSPTYNVSLPVNENTTYSNYSFSESSAWGISGNGYESYYNESLSNAPNYVYVKGNTVEFSSLTFILGADAYANDVLGTVYANLSIDGTIIPWSHVFNFGPNNASYNASYAYFAVITPSWNLKSTGYDVISNISSAVLQMTATACAGLPYGSGYEPSSLQTSTNYEIDGSDVNFQGKNETLVESSIPVESVPFDIGYHYGNFYANDGSYEGVPNGEMIYTLPLVNLTAFNIYWSTNEVDGSARYNGSGEENSGKFTGNITVNTIMFCTAGDPIDKNTHSYIGSYNWSYYLSSRYKVQHDYDNELLSSDLNFTQNINYYNGTTIFSVNNPDNAINNKIATTNGTINAITTAVWNFISDDIAYKYSPTTLIYSYSGYQSGSSTIITPTQYEYINETTYQSIPDTNLSISYSISYFLNYNPVVAINAVFSGQGTTLNLNVTTNESISNELQDISVQWTSTSSSVLTNSNVLSGTYTIQHNYTSLGTKNILVTVTNLPAVSKYDLTTSKSTTYTISLSVKATPIPDSLLTSGQSISITYTQSNMKISDVTLTINGNPATLTNSGTTYSGTSSLIGLKTIIAVWTLSTNTGFSKTLSYSYGTDLVPGYNSSFISVIGSNSATYTAKISISNSPSGNGYYQQEIIISNPSQYGITAKGSNFEIVYSNGTPAYSWIQSINQGTQHNITVWSKLANGTSSVDLEVYPSFENMLSSNGYIGEAPQLSPTVNEYDNVKEVFAFGSAMNSLSGFTLAGGTSADYSFAEGGLVITDSSFRAVSNYTVQQGQEAYYVLYNTTHNGNGLDFGIANETYGIAWHVSDTSLYYYNGTLGNSDYIKPQTGGQTIGYTYANITEGSSQTLVFSNPAYTDSVSVIGNPSGNLTFGERYDNGFSGQTGFNVVVLAVFVRNIPAGGMPTVSIGSAQPFLSNGTEITHQPYSIANPYAYNPTQESYTYDIYDSFNYNYITVIYNSSWQLVYPSITANTTGTLPASMGGGSYMQFNDISGVIRIAITFLQPSQLINTPSLITINPEQNNNSLYLSGMHVVSVYTPYQSTNQDNTTSYSNEITLPYGSNATFYIYNEWNQLIGEQKGVLIDSTSGVLTLPVSVATLSFYFVNSTTEPVSLSANGITISGFFGSATVAQNQTYTYTTQAYNGYTGKNENYHGIVNPIKAQSYTLQIYTQAPPALLTVNVNAYSGSNIGSIGSGGNPRVLAYIDGQNYTIGSSILVFEGKTYNIRIADMLNQTLYQTNYTLKTSQASLTLSITKPSYTIGIENDEVLPQNSVLATEYVSINKTGSSYHYNFTDSVGQNWVGYFATGNYTIHMHDNVTNTFYVNLTNFNQQRYLNGQALLNLTEFDNAINNVLNYTKSVQNTTYGLHIESLTSIQYILSGQSLNVSFGAYYNNYTAVSQSFLNSSSIKAIIINTAGQVQDIPFTTSISGNSITIHLTSVPSGNMSLRLIIQNGKYAGIDVYSFSSSAPVKSSVGLSLTIGVSSNIVAGENLTVPLYLYYSNGTTFNKTDTLLVFPSTTLYILQGNNIIHTYEAFNYSTGVIDFYIGALTAGSYTFYATVSPVNLSGVPLHGSAVQTENASPKSLSPLGTFTTGLDEFAHAIAQNLVVTLLVALAILLGTYGIRYLIKKINRKLKRDKADTQTVDDSLVADVTIKMTAGALTSGVEIVKRYNSLSYSEQDAFMRIPDGVLKNYAVMYREKPTSLMVIREKLQKLQKSENAKEIFSTNFVKEDEKNDKKL